MRTLGNNSLGVAAGAILRDGEPDRVQQILIADSFGQEFDRASLHGPNQHRNIGGSSLTSAANVFNEAA
jgi:hypothetical protein